MAIAQIARQHGVLLDPIYTLAAWEAALEAAQQPGLAAGSPAESDRVVMLHTGGASGLHGLAQRFPNSF